MKIDLAICADGGRNRSSLFMEYPIPTTAFKPRGSLFMRIHIQNHLSTIFDQRQHLEWSENALLVGEIKEDEHKWEKKDAGKVKQSTS